MSNILGNMPPVFGSGYRGVVPAPSAADVSAQNILRADGTWGAGPSGTLPSQTGNSGKLLTTDGTNASWSSTIGGNLTVSGTGNNVFRGPIRWGNTNWPGYNGYISEASTDSALNPAIARNLIGSTGSNYTIADGQLGFYSGFELGTDIRWFAASGTFTTGQSLVPTERMRLNISGNLLLKSDGIDSGNGKLQLAENTARTAGIGFGPDIALYRAGGNTLKLELGVSAAALWFDNGGLGTGGARFLGSSGALTITSNGANSLYLQTGGTTALTLDSSQRIITASTFNVGSGTNDAQFINVFTNKVQNTSGPFNITLPADCSGVVTLYSSQGGIGKSSWEIPFINTSGTVTVGTIGKTVQSGEPVSSAVAGSGVITVSVAAANTYCFWGIRVVKP